MKRLKNMGRPGNVKHLKNMGRPGNVKRLKNMYEASINFSVNNILTIAHYPL